MENILDKIKPKKEQKPSDFSQKNECIYSVKTHKKIKGN